MYACMRVCMYVCVCMHNACVCVSVRACVLVCMRACMNVCVCVREREREGEWVGIAHSSYS